MKNSVSYYEELLARSLLEDAKERYARYRDFSAVSEVRKLIKIPSLRLKLYPFYLEKLLDKKKYLLTELLARSYLKKTGGKGEESHRIKDSLFIAIMEQNRVEEAVDMLFDLVLEEPFPYRVSMLAWFYEMMGDYENAIAFYQAAYFYSFKYGVGGENYLKKLIKVLFEYGQIDENYELLKYAREVYGDKPWVMFFTAKWYYLKGYYGKARRYLSRLLKSGGAERYAVEARKLLEELDQIE